MRSVIGRRDWRRRLLRSWNTLEHSFSRLKRRGGGRILRHMARRSSIGKSGKREKCSRPRSWLAMSSSVSGSSSSSSDGDLVGARIGRGSWENFLRRRRWSNILFQVSGRSNKSKSDSWVEFRTLELWPIFGTISSWVPGCWGRVERSWANSQGFLTRN